MSAQVPDTTEMIGFRSDLYGCFTTWSDALFELCDAVLSSPAPVSVGAVAVSRADVPAWSRQPLQGADARCLDADRLRRSLVANRPADWPLVFAVDASTWARCDAECSPDAASTIAIQAFRRPADRRRLVLPMDLSAELRARLLDCAARRDPDRADGRHHRRDRRSGPSGSSRCCPPTPMSRCSSSMPATTRSLMPRAGRCPRPGCCAASATTASSTATRAAPEPSRGHRRDLRHATGPGSTAPTASTWPEPAAGLRTVYPGTGPSGSPPGTACTRDSFRRGHWTDHEIPPIVGRHRDPRRRRASAQADRASEKDAVAVVDRARPARSRPVLAGLPAPFRHRTHLPIRQEHPGWTTPALRTPEQADRWTWLIATALTQLRLARRLVDDHRLPWERPRRARTAHPGPRPPRVSSTSRDHRHPSQTTEIRQSRTRPPQRHPKTTQNPLPSD